MRSILLGFLSCALVACATQSSGVPEATPMPSSPGEDGFFLGEMPGRTGQRALREEQPLLAPVDSPAPASSRAVIYSAALRLVVVSAQEVFVSIQTIAKDAGGHLQESDSLSITIRVPAPSFEAVVQKIADLGEVVERSIRAADVTEEMLDLEIRLENLEKTRARLLEHLERSVVMEDTLAIERELARVSGEIEQLEGRRRYMQSQIAMSTIRVELNAPARERPGQDGLGLPFEWIARLGDGLLAGTVQALPRKPRFLSRGPRFEPPADFVRYYSDDDLVEAMNAGDLRLKLQEHDNYDEGALAFWTELARRSLVRSRALAVDAEREIDEERTLLTGTREVAGQTYGYLLVLARTKKRVYSFEAWGPQETFAPRLADLVESAQSLRL